jgi:hypothetical protein
MLSGFRRDKLRNRLTDRREEEKLGKQEDGKKEEEKKEEEMVAGQGFEPRTKGL